MQAFRKKLFLQLKGDIAVKNEKQVWKLVYIQ